MKSNYFKFKAGDRIKWKGIFTVGRLVGRLSEGSNEGIVVDVDRDVDRIFTDNFPKYFIIWDDSNLKVVSQSERFLEKVTIGQVK